MAYPMGIHSTHKAHHSKPQLPILPIKFIEGGGSIAWGIVPTSDFTGSESLEFLYTKLEQGLKILQGWGLDPETLRSRSLLTPSCGMGTMEPSAAEQVLDILSRLSERCRLDNP